MPAESPRISPLSVAVYQRLRDALLPLLLAPTASQRGMTCAMG